MIKVHILEYNIYQHTEELKEENLFSEFYKSLLVEIQVCKNDMCDDLL